MRINDSEDPEDQIFGFEAKTNSLGRFTIACLSGRRYRLHAYLSENYLAGTGVQSLPLDVDTGIVGRPHTLVLSKPGIFLSQLLPAPVK